MRDLIFKQVNPVIVLSKENMITNCLKNDELKMTRDDMAVVQQRINEFTKELEVLDTFEARLYKFEEKFDKKIDKIANLVGPVHRERQQFYNHVNIF